MSEPPLDPSTNRPADGPEPGSDFRWTALFQRCTEPLFLLSGRRQVLFVNRAWQQLTGLAASDVHKAVCKRRRDAEPGSCEAVLHAISPTREVMAGQPARVRRLVVQPGARPRWWDIEFLPFLGPSGVSGILGKIHVVGATDAAATQPLPEKLPALRLRLKGWWGLQHLPTEAPIMRRLAEQVRLASRTNVPVLLVGEPGSGKEWLARTIHQESPNRENPFVALDCRRLPAAALAWQFFGPPALTQRPGLTLFLKSPSCLPREVQARLCEQFTVAGEQGHGPRVLAAMSTDIEVEAQSGRLIEEFYCLLSPLIIQVPALRQHLDDLPHLVQRFLGRASSGRQSPVVGLTSEAYEVLRSYAWPGNLRELYAVLAGACLRAKGERLEPTHLPAFLRTTPPVQPRTLPLEQTLAEVERRLVQLALVQAKGNKSRAADILGILRPRLLRRLQALGLDENNTPP